MKCPRARKFLPLYVGTDLPAGKARRLEKHLRDCLPCQKEVKELRTTLESIRTIAGREIIDWPEGEWKALMARVWARRPEPPPIPVFLAVPRRTWAYGLMFILVIGVAVLILRAILSPPAAPLLSEIITVTSAPTPRAFLTESAAASKKPQDVPFSIQREKGPLERPVLAARPAPERETQDLVSMTLVSQETGLKIYWTLNKKFEWEEKKR